MSFADIHCFCCARREATVAAGVVSAAAAVILLVLFWAIGMVYVRRSALGTG